MLGILLTPFRQRPLSTPFSPAKYGNVLFWGKNGVDMSGSLWKDAYGSGRDASQSTSGYRPVLNPYGIGGLPTLDFDGVDDCLEFGDVLGKPANFTTIAVYRITDKTAAQYVFGSYIGSGSDSPWGGNAVVSGNGSIRDYNSDGSNFSYGDTPSGTLSNEIPVIIATKYTAGQTTRKIFKNGVSQTISIGATSANSNSGTAANYSIGKLGDLGSNFFKGSMAELIVFSSAVSDADISAIANHYKTKFSIGVYDSDAEAYFTRGAITNTTFKQAHSNYVIGLKAAGLWDKFYVIRPYDSTSLTAAAQNLKSSSYTATLVNFVDADLTSSKGLAGDGSTKYVNHNINPLSDMLQNDNGVTFYKTEGPNNTTGNAEFGCTDGTTYFQCNLQYLDNSYFYDTALLGPVQVADSNTSGRYSLNRTASNVLKAFRQGVQFGSTSAVASAAFPDYNVYSFARNAAGTPADPISSKHGYFAIHKGMTAAEVATHDTLLQTYMTALGR